jgi:hypothetical protein
MEDEKIMNAWKIDEIIVDWWKMDGLMNVLWMEKFIIGAQIMCEWIMDWWMDYGRMFMDWRMDYGWWTEYGWMGYELMNGLWDSGLWIVWCSMDRWMD